MKIRLPKLPNLNPRIRKLLKFPALAVLILGGLYVLVDINITPVALSLAEARVRAIAADTISHAVNDCVRDIGYEDLISVSRDINGRIALLQANSVRMNQLAADTAITAQESIRQLDISSVSIPLGTVFGGPIFSGRGPRIEVKVLPAGSVDTAFITSFTSAGINQTRHEVSLRLRATMRIAIPTGAKPVELTMQVPVAETVIVGNVPESYVNVESMDDALQLIP